MNKWSDTAKLVSYSGGGQDSDGFPIDLAREEKPVYCDMQSVKETEFFRAAEHGVNAVYTAVIHSFEYSGEKFVEYKGVEYSVYRSYEKKDKEVVELTLAENKRDG